jgi:sugar/nucleoside kinase (ribokinase family)
MIELLCIGEVMVELSTALSFNDAVCFEKSYAGDVFNTAITAQHLGIKTAFMTRLSDDPFSGDILTLMQACGLDTRFIRQVANRQLGLYLATYNQQGDWQAQYYRQASVGSTLHPDDMPTTRFLAAKAQGLQAVYSSGITLAISSTARDTVLKTFQLARQHQVLTCFDINYRPSLWPRQADALDTIGHALQYVDVLSTNLCDIQPLFGLDQPSHILEYCHRKGIQWLILRMGKQGCLLGHVTGAQHHFYALPDANPVDTITQPIGAGDAFNAALLSQLITNHNLIDAAQFAMATARQKLQSNQTVFLPETAPPQSPVTSPPLTTPSPLMIVPSAA